MKDLMNKTCLLLVMSLFMAPMTYAQDRSVSQLIKAELQEVNPRAGLVVFNGKQYKYNVDLKNALYQYEDAEKKVSINNLIVGETYYYNLYQKSDDKSSEFKLIFIAQEPQAE